MTLPDLDQNGSATIQAAINELEDSVAAIWGTAYPRTILAHGGKAPVQAAVDRLDLALADLADVPLLGFRLGTGSRGEIEPVLEQLHARLDWIEARPTPRDPAAVAGLVFYVDAKLGVLDAGGDPASNNEDVATWEDQASGQDLTRDGVVPHWIEEWDGSGQPAVALDYPTDAEALMENSAMGSAFQAAFDDVHDFTILFFDRPPADTTGIGYFVIGEGGVTGYLRIDVGFGFGPGTWTAVLANAAINQYAGYAEWPFDDAEHPFHTFGVRVENKVLYSYLDGTLAERQPAAPPASTVSALADLEGFSSPSHLESKWKDGGGGSGEEGVVRATRAWAIYNRALSQYEMDSIRAFWLERYNAA